MRMLAAAVMTFALFGVGASMATAALVPTHTAAGRRWTGADIVKWA